MVKPCYVYILASRAQGQNRPEIRLYTGFTDNVAKRLRAHNAGRGAKATRGRQWAVLYSEPHLTRGSALSREAGLKKRLRQKRGFRQALLRSFLP